MTPFDAAIVYESHALRVRCAALAMQVSAKAYAAETSRFRVVEVYAGLGAGQLPMQGDRECCLASGMDSYLANPITAHALYAILAQWQPVDGHPPMRRSLHRWTSRPLS